MAPEVGGKGNYINQALCSPKPGEIQVAELQTGRHSAAWTPSKLGR